MEPCPNFAAIPVHATEGNADWFRKFTLGNSNGSGHFRMLDEQLTKTCNASEGVKAEKWGGRRDSNPQQQAPQAWTLPLSYDHQPGAQISFSQEWRQANIQPEK
jgi:hypothetical protein